MDELEAPPPSPHSIPLEAVEEHATTIMSLLHLPLLLPLLSQYDFLSSEQLERISTAFHSEVERKGYLLQYVRRNQQRGVVMFVQCLRKTQVECKGHRKILTILEAYASDVPQLHPLLSVFEQRREDILRHLNFETFVNKLRAMGAITVHENMDVSNPHRSTEENTAALLHLLEQRPGADGLFKFIECLHADPNPGHLTLSQELLSEAQSIAQSPTHKSSVSDGDRVLLTQLERWKTTGTPFDRSLRDTLQTQLGLLARQLQLQSLVPLLVERGVVSQDDVAEMNQQPAVDRVHWLLEVVKRRGLHTVARFVECLRESPENAKSAMLFDITAAKATPKPVDKASKLAVLVLMDKYTVLKNDYQLTEMNISLFNSHIEEYRGTLKVCLDRLGFTTVDFGAELSERESETITGGPSCPASVELFQEFVVERCKKDAIVLVYICGIQFPMKSRDVYSAAILKDKAAQVSRRKSECLEMKDLLDWIEHLPTSYITLLVDVHHSHVAAFGKQRKPTDVEIMEDPWPSLTSATSSTVVFFLKPDTTAMCALRGSHNAETSGFGCLTEVFAKVLVSWIRRGQKEEVSHKLFYDAITFHWHKKGRTQKLFVPAVQGDVDRSFLGRTSHPHPHCMRADLLPLNEGGYDLRNLQVATGTMLGLIQGDEVEFYHVLHPEVKVKGRIGRVGPLSAGVEVEEEEEEERFGRLLKNIYEEEDVSKDGSAEFVMVRKRFPLHKRQDFAVGCNNLSDSEKETIRQYVRQSSMILSYAPKEDLVRLQVRKEGPFFTVLDVKRTSDGCWLDEDILYKTRVCSIQRIKSVLEIMAWFKFIKSLRLQSNSAFSCHLIPEKSLLFSSPQPEDYNIRSSTLLESHTPSDAVLQYSGESKFWVPDPEDPDPVLEVEFASNRVLTAIEIRSDPRVEGHMTKGSLFYRKLVYTGNHGAPEPLDRGDIWFSPIGPSAESEPAMFVTVKPLRWEGEEFTIAIKLLMKVVEGGKTRTKPVSSLTVMYWQYLSGKADWRIVPQPTPDGQLNLNQTDSWLQWCGKKWEYPLIFDLGAQVLLEKMETACIPGTNPLLEFKIELRKAWLCEELPHLPSCWPYRHQLSHPLIVSDLQLCPIEGRPFHLQLQLYGSHDERKVTVEEEDSLALYVDNFSDQQQWVYLYYLEETGKIEFVATGIAEPKNRLRKLLRVHIPKGYNPSNKQITDIYQVLISPKKLYLDPIQQHGLHDYHKVHCYDLCSLGRRKITGKDEQWSRFQFTVVIKRGSHN